MRASLFVIIFALAGALSCGMMEDFYEYSGKNFKTSVYIGDINSLHYSHDGGTTFQQYIHTFGPPGSYYVNSRREIMVVENSSPSPDFYVFVQKPDGSRRQVGLFDTNGMVRAAANGDFYYYISTGSENRLYRLPDGGNTLQLIERSSAEPAEQINGFWVIDIQGSTSLFVFTDNAGYSNLYRSIDGGVNFTFVKSFTSTIYDIVSRKWQIFLLADDAAMSKLYESRDGGASFSDDSLYTFGLNFNRLAVNNNGWIYVAGNSNYIYYSDDGNNWPQFNPYPMENVVDLAADHSNRLYILYSGGLFFSDDLGFTAYKVNSIYGTSLQVVEYHD